MLRTRRNLPASSVTIGFKDATSIDAFGRLRVSEPLTLFESKQIHDNQSQFWDESLESGAGITSAHNANEAATTITSTLNTAGTFTRQTFMRFNYQPGKSQLVLMTGILEHSGGGTGVQCRLGLFDDNNGLFFSLDNGIANVTRRTNVTGSPVDTSVASADWSVDQLDGTGPSGVTIDWTKTQIWFVDFEWLGVGRVRMGVVIDGLYVLCHEFLNANILDRVYMSTPNLPLRYQLITTSSSPASSIMAICATVMSEGGESKNGILNYASTGGTHVDANSENTIYAIIGLRLQPSHIGTSIDLVALSIAELAGNNEFEWIALLNPTVAGTFTYSDHPLSAVQTAFGVTANTITGGVALGGGFGTSTAKGSASAADLSNAIRLGSSINGTMDTWVLGVRPINGSSNTDVEAGVSWREL